MRCLCLLLAITFVSSSSQPITAQYTGHVTSYQYPVLSLSTHTPYESVRGDILNVTWESNLTPQRIYLLARHGSRHLGSDSINMDKFLDKLLQTNYTDKFPWLGSWNRPRYISDYQLVEQGMLEHYKIAHRFRRKFPSLFPRYYPGNYSVRATYKLRTSQSAAAFMDGLFDQQGPLDATSTVVNISSTGYQPTAVEIDSKNQDILLRFMENCPAYEFSNETLHRNAQSKQLVASDRFKETVVGEISKSVGFDVDLEDVKGLYSLCTFEEVSPTQAGFSRFCGMLPRSSIQLLEYEHDLGNYYKSSYPNKLGYEISCTILQDMLHYFTKDRVVPALRFAHSETLIPVFTLLGLFNDSMPLLWSTERFEERRFKMSRVVPFAANIALVMFSDNETSQEYVKVYINEREVRVPACLSTLGCTLHDIQHIINTTQHQCDFHKMCYGPQDQAKLASKTKAKLANSAKAKVALSGVLTNLTEEQLIYHTRLEVENKVAVNLYLFLAMVVVSALSCLLCGFIVMNRHRLFSEEEYMLDRNKSLNYQKMPFLES